MATSNINLKTRAIQAKPEQLNLYVREAVATLERAVLAPPSEQLSNAELAVLREGGFDPDDIGPTKDDPLARTVAEYAGLTETAISTRQAARALGRDESRVRQRLAERTLYGIRHGRGWVLPLFQFEVRKVKNRLEPRREIPGLAQVISKLNTELDPVSVYRWFITPSDELWDEKNNRALSPRDWLLAGYPVEPVARFAADV